MNVGVNPSTAVDEAVQRVRRIVGATGEERKPRIAFYIPALNVGGAQRVTVNIANELAARGYPVDVVLAYREGALLSDVSDAVRIVDLETPRIPVVGVLASVPGLRSYLRTERPAVLFSAMTYANVAAILAAELAGTQTRLVATEHNTFGMNPDPKVRLTRVIARPLYRLADRVAAVSEGVADSVRKGTAAADDDVTVLYNPIEIEAIRDEAAEPVDHPWLTVPEYETAVTVGRIEPQKDHTTLLRAFARVSERRPNARLVVVGTGTERDRLRELAAELEIDNIVDFPGYVENAYAYMQNADLFVLSSRHEGLPTVLLEALACGCPIVSTDCPSGPREILEDGRYGPLVPVGDDGALADAIVGTFDDPVDEAALLERARDFSMEAAVDGYERLIRRLAVERDAR